MINARVDRRTARRLRWGEQSKADGGSKLRRGVVVIIPGGFLFKRARWSYMAAGLTMGTGKDRGRPLNPRMGALSTARASVQKGVAAWLVNRSVD